MENIKKLKIGNYVLTFDKFFKKDIRCGGEDVLVDHCGGSKSFKNIEDYNRFYDYMEFGKWNCGDRHSIIYDGFTINFIYDSTFTISFEMYSNDELWMKLNYEQLKEFRRG